MKTAIISFEKYHGRAPGSIGSSVIRAKWLQEKWAESFLWSNGESFDRVIFQKVYWRDMMTDCKAIGIPMILDLCDPDWLNMEKNSCPIKELTNLVDGITCSTENLTKVVRQVTNKPVEYIPDRLNLNYFTKKKEHEDRARNVVWFGYSHNADEVLPQVLPSLKRLDLNLYVVSNSEFIPTDDYGVLIRNIKYDANAFINIQNCDMAINPPSLKSNFRFKSNNKTIISWALGVPVASTADDMERFLDPSERNKEIKIREKEIKDKYDITLSVKQYEGLFQEIKR